MVFTSILFTSMAMLPLADLIPVTLQRSGERWQMMREGKPYAIKGAGGNAGLQKLKDAGGNSTRTWGTENALTILDEAQKLGMTVTVGIWLGHKAHGFSYSNEKQVKEQFDRAREDVRKLKNHPALLAWALGNEMENNNDTPELWKAIGALAAMVKSEDPNHPIMTVVAEIGDDKIKRIQQFAPGIQVLGVNSYGGCRSLPERLAKGGWTKPYVVTEFGPLGPWEVGKTSWGAPIEATSTQKAEMYLASFEQGVASKPEQCLGSYVFLWGEKQETTPTWFGMFLQSGEALGTVDAMTRAWTGKWPSARAPEIQALSVSPDPSGLVAGAKVSAKVEARDPNGDKLTYRWAIKPEVEERKFAGDGEKRPEALNLLATEKGSSTVFAAPSVPGAYRIYVWVFDGTGRAATANVPFLVKL